MRNTPQAWDALAAQDTPWEAALWSREGQQVRFEAIMRHLPLKAGDALLDFGCGTGGLCDYLPGNVFYVGWDWSPLMRERARVEHQSAAILDQAPRDEKFDHVVCCGTFNLAANWTHEKTWSVVRRLWRRQTLKCLAVSLYRGRHAYSLHYGLDEIADFVWSENIRKYVIDASYRDNDILLCCLK